MALRTELGDASRSDDYSGPDGVRRPRSRWLLMRPAVGVVVALSVFGSFGWALSAGTSSVTEVHPSMALGSLTPVAAVARMAESAKSMRSASYEFRMNGPMGSSFAGHGAYSNTPKPALDMTFDSASIAGLGGGSPG